LPPENKLLNYKVLAYYYFANIENPREEVEIHKRYLADKDFSSRIYISEEGINGQACGLKEHAEAYMNWMKGRELFSGIKFKIHNHHEHIFPRKDIKFRNQLVAMDTKVDLKKTGVLLSSREWRKMLKKEDKKVLVDVRNDYEWNIGHFKGAELPELKNFREFREYAEDLKQKTSLDTPVMMYCTGGIRCEYYSSYLLEKGFNKVYHLDGGVLGYRLENERDEGYIIENKNENKGAEIGNDKSYFVEEKEILNCNEKNNMESKAMGNQLKEGQLEEDEFWVGKIFVFDDRLAVPLNEKIKSPTISECLFCKTNVDKYFNCANALCNKLFICCTACIAKSQGCCSDACQISPKLRKFKLEGKPFKRKLQEQLVYSNALVSNVIANNRPLCE
jgi:UPF0176 protein